MRSLRTTFTALHALSLSASVFNQINSWGIVRSAQGALGVEFSWSLAKLGQGFVVGPAAPVKDKMKTLPPRIFLMWHIQSIRVTLHGEVNRKLKCYLNNPEHHLALRRLSLLSKPKSHCLLKYFLFSNSRSTF